MTDPCVEAVTPDMVEAGFQVLWTSELSSLCDNPGHYRRLAQRIYTAMHSSRPAVEDGLVDELRHSGWISQNTNAESDAPWRGADRIEAQASELVALKGEIETLKSAYLNAARERDLLEQRQATVSPEKPA